MTYVSFTTGLVLAVAALAPAVAEPAPPPATVESAKTLMLSGRTQEARSMLQELASRNSASNDVAFLLGLLAIDAADYRHVNDHQLDTKR